MYQYQVYEQGAYVSTYNYTGVWVLLHAYRMNDIATVIFLKRGCVNNLTSSHREREKTFLTEMEVLLFQ